MIRPMSDGRAHNLRRAELLPLLLALLEFNCVHQHLSNGLKFKTGSAAKLEKTFWGFFGSSEIISFQRVDTERRPYNDIPKRPRDKWLVWRKAGLLPGVHGKIIFWATGLVVCRKGMSYLNPHHPKAFWFWCYVSPIRIQMAPPLVVYPSKAEEHHNVSNPSLL